MSAIVWDAAGSRFFESGTDHGVLYVQESSGAYGKGVPWNGLTAVTESPSGAEPTDLWADNIKYATLRSAESFGGTIEAYTYPDEFMACDGSAEVIPGVVIGQQGRKNFGLVYRTKIGNDVAAESDKGYKLHVVWGASASPSEKSYATINDSPDAITFSWEFTTTPVAVEGYKPTSMITINAAKLDEDKLTLIENKLFGTASTEPTLPTPEELIDLLTA